MTTDDGQFDGAERRESARFATDRRARFSNDATLGPLRTGRVIDMSPTGLRIDTTSPEPVGTPLQVELPAVDGGLSENTIVDGTVVRLEHASEGLATMGVACSIVAPVERMTRVVASPKQPELTRPTVPVSRDALPVEVAYRRIAAPPRRSERRIEWLVAGVLFAFVLGLLAAAGFVAQPRVEATPGGSSMHRSDAVVETEEPEPIERAAYVENASRPTAESSQEERYESIGAATPEALLSDVQAALSSGELGDARKRLDRLGESAPDDRPEKFIARYAYAMRAARESERGLAMKVLRDALDEGGKTEEVWRDLAASELSRLEGDRSYVPGAAPMDTRLAFSAVADAMSDAPVSVEVDASAYVLRVLRNGDVVRSFPVGLGRDGATPLGRFTISDKIVDPDWYDRGRSVPADSPENPLGSRWMGLARAGDGTGVGIHPTDQQDSIEQPMSRGCVRMRPADAEELFRLAPAGTPVTIHL